MNEKIDINISEEKNLENEALSESEEKNEKISETLEDDEEKTEQIEKDKITVLDEHLKKLLSNSYVAQICNKNLLSLKIEFFITIKEYIKKLKHININLKVMENFDSGEFKVIVTNIEVLLSILKNVHIENFEEKINLTEFLSSLKNISFEKNIKDLDTPFIEVVTEDNNFKEHFEKTINSLDFILKETDKFNSMNDEIDEENIEKFKYQLAFNFLEEIYQESEILLSLTNSFLKYTIWIESLLEIIIKESREKELNENLITLIEKILSISEKMLKTKIVAFDSDELTNSLDKVIALEEETREKYKNLINLDEVYTFSNMYIAEKFPHLEKKFNVFVSQKKKKEYIKVIPILLEELDKKLTEEIRCKSFFNNSNEFLKLIKKIINSLNLINKKDLSVSELEEFNLIEKINSKIEEIQKEYENEIENLRNVEESLTDNQIQQSTYENLLYCFNSFKNTYKKFMSIKDEKNIQADKDLKKEEIFINYNDEYIEKNKENIKKINNKIIKLIFLILIIFGLSTFFFKDNISQYLSISNIEPIPRITNEKILNQDIAREISSYNNKKLEDISKGYSIRYSSFKKSDKQFGEKYVFFMFFGKDGYTYRISCSRDGILAMNVYSGSGGFLHYTIPNLENPTEIFSYNIENDKLTLLNFKNMDKSEKKIIKEILNIFEEFYKNDIFYSDYEINKLSSKFEITPIQKVTNKKILNINENFYDIYIFQDKNNIYPISYCTAENNGYYKFAYIISTDLGIPFGNDYQYTLCCLRNGIIQVEVSMGDEIVLLIPNMSEPTKIDFKTKEITYHKNKKEHLLNIEIAIQIFKKFAVEHHINLGF